MIAGENTIFFHISSKFSSSETVSLRPQLRPEEGCHLGLPGNTGVFGRGGVLACGDSGVGAYMTVHLSSWLPQNAQRFGNHIRQALLDLADLFQVPKTDS